MPALFAYLVALSLLLGGGYASLQWLSAPDTSATPPLSKSKRPPANKDVVEKSAPHVTGATPAKPRPYDRAEPEITGSAPAPEASNKPASIAPEQAGVIDDNTKVQPKKAEEVPPGGCMPIGVTAQGEFVFPMQCQGLLEQNRGPLNPQAPVPTISAQSPAPEDQQTPELAQPVGLDKGSNRNESPSNEVNPKVADISPSRDDLAVKETSKPEVIKEKTAKGRNTQFSHPKRVMMILRTIEFPDGHREQRLLPMNRSRKMASQQWFNPLTFDDVKSEAEPETAATRSQKRGSYR
jgi:hypothetical protein